MISGPIYYWIIVLSVFPLNVNLNHPNSWYNGDNYGIEASISSWISLLTGSERKRERERERERERDKKWKCMSPCVYKCVCKYMQVCW